MLQVLIVDDEPWVAYGIAHMIDWNSLGYEIIGEVYDGQHALEMITELLPDLVISDIRMPGLSGIELLERIRGLQLETKVILVSGYTDFEYAQKAIRYGAFDYLVKQIDALKLEEAIHRLTVEMNRKREAYEEYNLLQGDLFEWLNPANKFTIEDFQVNQEVTGMLPDYRFICCLYPADSSPGIAEGVHQYPHVSVTSLRTGYDKISLLLNYDEHMEPLELLDFITNELSDARYIGISGIGGATTPISRLYQESEIVMFSACFHQTEQLAHYKPPVISTLIRKCLLKLEQSIKEKDNGQVEVLLEQISTECRHSRIYIDRIAIIYNQVISIIHKYHHQLSPDNELEFLSYEQIIRMYHTPEQLFTRMKSLLEQLSEQDIHVSNEAVEKIIAYINSRYMHDLSLSEIAKMFHLSLGYLSTLIKKETGVTYSEYIMHKRLSMAKELLGDSSLSVAEVVEQIGYKDYYHFNKLFKKNFGITPSQYRKI